MNTIQQAEGYEYAKGALGFVARCAIIMAIILTMFTLLRNIFGWGMDDSDKDAWHRSGLRIYTDAKTGAQYLSDSHGGLVRRESEPK